MFGDASQPPIEAPADEVECEAVEFPHDCTILVRDEPHEPQPDADVGDLGAAPDKAAPTRAGGVYAGRRREDDEEEEFGEETEAEEFDGDGDDAEDDDDADDLDDDDDDFDDADDEGFEEE